MMRKNLLALSVTAALGSLGLSTGVQAMGLIDGVGSAGVPLFGTSGGLGTHHVVPFFSAAGGNATLLSVTNTDTTNGKAIKVRFRGATNSDDLYDFQIFLSPGDMWTAAVSKGADGRAQIVTSDASCTNPATVSGSFSTVRVDPGLSADDKAAQTLEGYVEFITMANVSTSVVGTTASNALYTAIKHVNGVAPCRTTTAGAAAFAKLNDDPANTLAAYEAGLDNPTGGVGVNWTIVNTLNATAYSGEASSWAPVAQQNVPGNIVFWPQVQKTVTQTDTAQLALFTADPVINSAARATGFAGATTTLPDQLDLPDLSTAYGTGTSSQQVSFMQIFMHNDPVINEYWTGAEIAAKTDWLFTFPTRRYSAGVIYGATSAAATATFNPNTLNFFVGAGDQPTFSAANLSLQTSDIGTMKGAKLCLKNVTQGFGFTGREEQTQAPDPTQVVVSPQPVNTPSAVYLCGEASIVALGNAGTSALEAVITRNTVSSPFIATNPYGWASIGLNLPLIGSSYMKANNGVQNYGFRYQHKGAVGANSFLIGPGPGPF